MDDEFDTDILRTFYRVPHRGLSRIVDSLNILKISMMKHHWKSVGDDIFPRIERVGFGGVVLSLGVTRERLVGHISWVSVHRAGSAIITLSYYEDEKRWMRSYRPGSDPEPEFDHVISTLFPNGAREIKLDDEMFVNVMLQHFANLFDLE